MEMGVILVNTRNAPSRRPELMIEFTVVSSLERRAAREVRETASSFRHDIRTLKDSDSFIFRQDSHNLGQGSGVLLRRGEQTAPGPRYCGLCG
jgi:hypothetical protein